MAGEMINFQPQGTTPMTASGNRNALNREVGGDGQRDWSYGLFTFSNCGLCCWAFLCPCVVYSQNKQRLYHLQTRGTPLPGGGEVVDGSCCLYACLGSSGLYFILQMGSRWDTRARYNVRGDAAVDCLVSSFCHVGGLIQERREIELEESTFEGFEMKD